MFRNSWNIDVSVDESFRHVYNIHIYSIYNLQIQGMGFILSWGGGAEEWDLLGTGDIKIVAVSHAVLAEDYRGGAVPAAAVLSCDVLFQI